MNKSILQASDYETEKAIILTTINGGKFDAILRLKIEDAECQVTVTDVEKSKDCCYQGIIDTIRKDGEQKHDLKCRGKAINFCERHITHKNTEAPAFKRS
ncbi:hypothetical protein PU634_11200 [Oceanimonas pelagia]|uniref:Uncharacterized protein n=1 Tax=Oceanimonas pelagia TaxID=3028314 RepID=A0AA50QAY6_9GAMM|nr:hypothetical protein [Oceanimonas pelagia]WMC09682.1 hypothetical protein PU634_11200 [Oceanimonas pelagia]